jgi:UDP-N-acetyl-alpha-D-muramoyl-L-alanyl-L-glutamate epimerase
MTQKHGIQNLYKSYIFKKYEFDQARGEAKFYYSFDDKINFTEIFKFNESKVEWEKANSKLIDAVLFNLHLAAGISYYKAYCPKKIIIESGVLSRDQAKFWNNLYTNGLGEFFYKNKIDFRGLINFPYGQVANKLIKFRPPDCSLVPVGGGKDSIVTAELLKKNNCDFSLFTLRDSKIQSEVSALIGQERIVVEREMDKKLFELNKKGALNGHVPISAIYSFTALLASALYGFKYIIFSNEKSANYGNVKYLGKIINHQYSKSFEFEKNISGYIKKYISPSIKYFSLLRPFSELKIVEIFSRYKKYFKIFSSCNRNFKLCPKGTNSGRKFNFLDHKLTGAQSKRWCGECPKCAFVFALLSAFIPKKELINIYGKNLYADKKLSDVFSELLGEKNIKPFDCIGTPEEMKLAMYLAWQRGDFNTDVVIKNFIKDILPKIKNVEKLQKKILEEMGKHNVPKNFSLVIPAPEPESRS